MILTEKEAREKWCPHAREALTISFSDGGVPGTGQYLAGDPVANRWTTRQRNSAECKPARSRCIASECMAWRWSDGDPGLDRVAREELGLTFGYCGLAGGPFCGVIGEPR